MATVVELSNQVSDEKFAEFLAAMKDADCRYRYGETVDGTYTGQTHLFYTPQEDLEKLAKDNGFFLNGAHDDTRLTVGKEIQWDYDDNKEVTAWCNEVIGVFVEYM